MKMTKWFGKLKNRQEGAVMGALKLMRTFALLSSILLIMTVFSGCVSQEKKVDYELNTLLVSFNGLREENVTAVTSFNRTKEMPSGIDNVHFKNYISGELNKLAKNLSQVKNISILYWYNSDSMAILISYDSKTTETEKFVTLEKLKVDLESKWYVVDVNHDYKGGALGKNDAGK